MMDGFLLTLWCVPTMTLGHLQFALLMTAYILVGVHMEERGLLRRLTCVRVAALGSSA
jgi:hypothetical protein